MVLKRRGLNKVRYHIPLVLILPLVFSCSQENDVSILNDLEDKPTLLITTDFSTYEELLQTIAIFHDPDGEKVTLEQNLGNRTLTSVLKGGLKESSVMQARNGGLIGKTKLLAQSPYFAANRKQVLKVWYLSRWRSRIFGPDDKAFFDLAVSMNHKIIGREMYSSADLSEKGFINTFNHVNSQAFMTILFSEKLADFIADSHERSAMPALITGDFADKQRLDILTGAVDNYVDIINNEWGQELGKHLKHVYGIDSESIWTTAFLTSIVNDMLSFYKWSLNIEFVPFSEDEEIIVKLARKLQKLQHEFMSI